MPCRSDLGGIPACLASQSPGGHLDRRGGSPIFEGSPIFLGVSNFSGGGEIVWLRGRLRGG